MGQQTRQIAQYTELRSDDILHAYDAHCTLYTEAELVNVLYNFVKVSGHNLESSRLEFCAANFLALLNLLKGKV